MEDTSRESIRRWMRDLGKGEKDARLGSNERRVCENGAYWE